MSQTFGPYSAIRQAGNIYFVSGQIGVDASTGTASKDVDEQVRQALKNLQTVLATKSLTVADVVKTTIFVTSIDDFAQVNEIYMEFFPEPRPARSTVEVSALPKISGSTLLKIEIEAVAYKA